MQSHVEDVKVTSSDHIEHLADLPKSENVSSDFVYDEVMEKA